MPARALSPRWVAAAAALAGTLLAAPAAHADDWVIAGELPAAVPVSAPQRDRFEVGALPALAVLRGLGSWFFVGARVRGGALGDGPAPGDNLADPGMGGLASLTASARITPGGRGPWLELGAGAGLTGEDTVPAFEAGVGWRFGERFGYGPSVRMLHVIGSDDPMSLGSASVVTLGLEVQLGSSRPRPLIVAAAPVMPATSDDDLVVDREDACHPELILGCPDYDRDRDGIKDAADACPEVPETINGVDDGDGCPDQGLFEVVNDRIVLEEEVFFDVLRARVKRGSRPTVRAIVVAWDAHPEWDRIVVEGHADVRGPDELNQQLSEARAARVREALVAAGVPADRVEAKGYGKTRPRDPGTSPAAHGRNRRVEFVIIRGAPRDGAVATPAVPVEHAAAGGGAP